MTDTPEVSAPTSDSNAPRAHPCARAGLGVLFVTALLGAVLLARIILTPLHTATAVIDVRYSFNPAVFDSWDNKGFTVERFIDELHEHVRSSEILQRALEMTEDPNGELAINIPATEWYQSDPDSARARLRSALRTSTTTEPHPYEAETSPRTSPRERLLFDIHVTDTDPRTATMLANAVARAVELHSREQYIGDCDAQLAHLTTRRNELRYQLLVHPMSMRPRDPLPPDVLREYTPPSVKSHLAVLVQQQTLLKMDLEGQLEQAQTELAELEGDTVHRAIGRAEIEIAALREDLSVMEAEIRANEDKLTNEHYTMRPGERNEIAAELQRQSLRLMEFKVPVKTLENERDALLEMRRTETYPSPAPEKIDEVQSTVNVLKAQIALLESDLASNKIRLTKASEEAKEEAVYERLYGQYVELEYEIRRVTEQRDTAPERHWVLETPAPMPEE